MTSCLQSRRSRVRDVRVFVGLGTHRRMHEFDLGLMRAAMYSDEGTLFGSVGISSRAWTAAYDLLRGQLRWQ